MTHRSVAQNQTEEHTHTHAQCSSINMSVLFRSSDSDAIVEVGEYQEFSQHEARPEVTPTESPAKPSKESEVPEIYA